VTEVGGWCRYELRPLGELPWPHGLGKRDSYPLLERRMQQLLGDEYRDTDANRRWFESSADYREIAESELSNAAWSTDLLASVDAAGVLAQTCPVFGRTLPHSGAWDDWVRPLHTSLGRGVREWLGDPASVTATGIGNGRHRLTFLRLHHPPEHLVLVRTRG